ncbi:hypothetical protein SYYSPA8_21320 [Streptomyces yaizuensis]|uniref:Uncharacterized protein n=1 Tax=Streptomyces yaizuensis TaxID=2989713 RepID=A0ABQ5P2Q2_9ACTN|nr:hypothetical protein SYYSPA8_21320 [Streptomyces sp. YSPA8]
MDTSSYPTDDAQGWTVTTSPVDANHDPRTVTVRVVCD